METYNITFTSEVWYDLWRLTIPNYCEECDPEELTIEGVLSTDNEDYHSDWDNVLEFLLREGLCETFGSLPIECYARYANVNLLYTDWSKTDGAWYNVVYEVAQEQGVDISKDTIEEIVYHIMCQAYEGCFFEEEYGWTYHEDTEHWAEWENYTDPCYKQMKKHALEFVLEEAEKK